MKRSATIDLHSSVYSVFTPNELILFVSLYPEKQLIVELYAGKF